MQYAEDKPQSVLVTGASGFIGRGLVKSLASAGRFREVIGVDLLPEVGTSCGKFYQSDLRTFDLAEALKKHAVGTIFHLAAIAKEPGYSWREYFEQNDGVTRIVSAAAVAADVRNIVYTSTMMVFSAGPERHAETDQPDPDTAYGMSKLLGERSLESWVQGDARRRLRIVRPGVVFGEGDESNMKRLVKAVRRRRFAYVGRRDTIKSCIYLTDLLSLLELLADDHAPHTIYHAVYPSATSIQDIVQAVCEAFGISRRPPVVPYALALALAAPVMLVDPMGRRLGFHPRRVQKLYFDTNVSAGRLDELGWRARFSLREAFVDWASRDPSVSQ